MYIYHLKPEPFIGNELIPLNTMDPESDLYKSHAIKYMGREELTEESIPLLNCKWNDVVQFSGLDPQKIVNELKKYQYDLRIGRLNYFKIHIDQIVGHYPAVIFDRDATRGKGSFKILDREIKILNHKNYEELAEVPHKTIEYWQKVQKEGGKFLWFPYVTHIMVKGKIDVRSFELCSLHL